MHVVRVRLQFAFVMHACSVRDRCRCSCTPRLHHPQADSSSSSSSGSSSSEEDASAVGDLECRAQTCKCFEFPPRLDPCFGFRDMTTVSPRDGTGRTFGGGLVTTGIPTGVSRGTHGCPGNALAALSEVMCVCVCCLCVFRGHCCVHR
jgi:hypothetical protein